MTWQDSASSWAHTLQISISVAAEILPHTTQPPQVQKQGPQPSNLSAAHFPDWPRPRLPLLSKGLEERQQLTINIPPHPLTCNRTTFWGASVGGGVIWVR